MNAFFASAALGLVAAWPVSGLGWVLGKTADKLTGDPALRAAAWNRAVSLPHVMLGLMLGATLLPEETTAPVYQVVTSSKAVATVGAAMNEAAVRTLSGFNAVEIAGAALILGAVGGLAVAAGRQAIGRVKLERIVREARPADAELALAVRAAARRMDTGRPEVRISDQIDQPLLAGLTTPVILLPSELVARLDIKRLVPICAHELGHLKRGDNWRLMLEHLVGGLFWMVPPFALLRARAAAAREELCDALALDGAAPDIRVGYAESLIDVLRSRAAPTFHSAFTGKGPRTILMRLNAITDPRRPAGFARKVLLGVISVAAFAAAGAASIALAQQGGPAGRNVVTRITSPKDGQNITIKADKVKLASPTANLAPVDTARATPALARADAPSPANAPIDVTAESVQQIPDQKTTIFNGNVTVRGSLPSATVTLLIDGAPAPAGFDPTRLGDRDITRMVVSQTSADKHMITTMDFTLAPGVLPVG